jgi:acyl-ACP thioesterase
MAPEILEEEVNISVYDADFQERWKPAGVFSAIQRVGGRHADLLGYSYEKMTSIRRAWVLSRIKIRFIDIPKVGDTVIVRTAPKGIQQKVFFIRDSQIVNTRGSIVAEATTAWLVIDMDTWRMMPVMATGFTLPQPVNFCGLNEPLDKLCIPDGLSVNHTVTATYNTLDGLGHVNNARYPEWITDCFSPEYYRTHRVDWLQINYNHEVKPGEQVVLSTGGDPTDPTVAYVQGVSQQQGHNCFDAALGWAPVNP